MEFQTVLDEIDAEIRPLLGAAGTVASYIPALARVPAEHVIELLEQRYRPVGAGGDWRACALGRHRRHRHGRARQ